MLYLVASAAALPTTVLAQAPIIVQPGAPGQASKVLSPAEVNIPLRPPVQADIEFVQGMIVHHSQAVEMTDLLRTRTSTKALQEIGKRISISQSDEIEFMKQWLRDRGQPVSAPGGHTMHHIAGMDLSKMNMASDDVPLMPGMLSPNQMKALAKARARQFDKLFLTGMIQHHTGALDMVEDLFAIPGAGQDPVLFDFATDIDTTQRAEINIMKALLPQVSSKISPKDGR